MEETKAAKAFKKANVGKVSSIIMGGLKYANPVYWVKKLFVGSTINFASRKNIFTNYWYCSRWNK